MMAVTITGDTLLSDEIHNRNKITEVFSEPVLLVTMKCSGFFVFRRSVAGVGRDERRDSFYRGIFSAIMEGMKLQGSSSTVSSGRLDLRIKTSGHK